LTNKTENPPQWLAAKMKIIITWNDTMSECPKEETSIVSQIKGQHERLHAAGTHKGKRLRREEL